MSFKGDIPNRSYALQFSGNYSNWKCQSQWIPFDLNLGEWNWMNEIFLQIFSMEFVDANEYNAIGVCTPALIWCMYMSHMCVCFFLFCMEHIFCSAAPDYCYSYTKLYMLRFKSSIEHFVEWNLRSPEAHRDLSSTTNPIRYAFTSLFTRSFHQRPPIPLCLCVYGKHNFFV